MSNWNMVFGPERVVVRSEETGIEVRIPDTMLDFDYVRVVMTGARAEDKVNGKVLEGECELVYWDKQEWEDEPGDMLEIILATVRRVAEAQGFEVEFGHAAFL